MGKKCLNKFYVYIYLDPRKNGNYTFFNNKIIFNNEPFYIGKGTGSRSRDHLRPYCLINQKNKIKTNKIKKILKETGNEPIIKIFKNNLTNSSANRLEKLLIKKIGRVNLKTGPLTNLTDGGDGTVNVVLSKLTLQNMSKRHKGKKNRFWKTSLYNYWKKHFGQQEADIRMHDYKIKMSKLKAGLIPHNKIKLNNFTIKKLICLKANGHTEPQIAKKLNLTRKIIENRVKQFSNQINQRRKKLINRKIEKINFDNLPKDRNRNISDHSFDKNTLKQIIILYLNGKHYEEIIKELNLTCSKSTIFTRIKKFKALKIV